MHHCKNCGNAIRDQYCSHCGQKTKIDRITFAYLWHELFHFLTHIEKGFLFTSVQMLKSPGKTITDFIEGKRKRYQSPVSYFLIWTTIYILFLYWIEFTYGENIVINYKDYFGPSGATKFAISHLSLVLTIVIPFQALYLFLLVTYKKYNYAESLVAAIYVIGTIILLQFVFAVFAVFIHIMSSASADLRVSDAFKAIYLAWFIFNMIKRFPVRQKFMRSLAFIVLAFGTFSIWRLYGVPYMINWFLAKH